MKIEAKGENEGETEKGGEILCEEERAFTEHFFCSS